MSARDTQPDAAPWDGPMQLADALACESCGLIELDNAGMEIVFLPACECWAECAEPCTFEAWWVCVSCADITLDDQS